MMSFWRSWRALYVLTVAASMVAGCGSGEADTRPRQAVSGEVTLDGQPLATGQVIFDPKSRASGVAAQGPVVDGKFSIGTTEGPTPGDYLVRIDSGGAAATKNVASKKLGDTKRDIEGVGIKSLIPSRFNVNTTLSADVKEGGPNAFKFELDSKPDSPTAKKATGRKGH